MYLKLCLFAKVDDKQKVCIRCALCCIWKISVDLHISGKVYSREKSCILPATMILRCALAVNLRLVEMVEIRRWHQLGQSFQKVRLDRCHPVRFLDGINPIRIHLYTYIIWFFSIYRLVRYSTIQLRFYPTETPVSFICH